MSEDYLDFDDLATNQAIGEIEDTIDEARTAIAMLQTKLTRARELYVEQATKKEQETYAMWLANSGNPIWIEEARRNYENAMQNAEDVFWHEVNAAAEDPGNPDDSNVGEYRRGYR